MSDESSFWSYGDENECMAFDRRCKCGRFMKMPKEIEYRISGDDERTLIISKAQCSKCGEVDLNDHFEGYY